MDEITKDCFHFFKAAKTSKPPKTKTKTFQKPPVQTAPVTRSKVLANKGKVF